jgi:hypothetical protein
MYSNTIILEDFENEVDPYFLSSAGLFDDSIPESRRPQVTEFPKMYFVPIIFSIVYFIIIAMMWSQSKWFRNLNITLSPIFLTILWALIFIGIIWTWIRCLQGSVTRSQTTWVTIWFIVNLLLLLLVAWSFFIGKNIATASFMMIFLWISTLILIFVASRFYTPGVIFGVIYLIIITWVWVVFGRLAYTMMHAKNKLIANGFVKAIGWSKKDGVKGMMTTMQQYFDMNAPKTATPSFISTPVTTPAVSQAYPTAPTGQASQDEARNVRRRQRQQEKRGVDTVPAAAKELPRKSAPAFVEERLEAPIANAGTPHGTWRSRGLSCDV